MRVVLLALACAAGLAAQPSPSPSPATAPQTRWASASMEGVVYHRPFEGLKEYLDLTNEQVEQLQRSMREIHEHMGPLQGQIHGLQEQLEGLLRESADPAAIGETMVKLRELEAELPSERAKQHERALAVLTGAQQAKLEELKEALKLSPLAHEAQALQLIPRPDHHMRHGGVGIYRQGGGMHPAVFLGDAGEGVDLTRRVVVRRVEETTGR